MNQEKQVVFRRIRGRIVPIKVNKSSITPKRPSRSNKAVLTGVSTIAAGIGLSLGGSFVAGRLLKSALKQGSIIKRYTKTAQLAQEGVKRGSTSSGIRDVMLTAATRRTPKFRRTLLSSKLALGITTGFGGATVLDIGVSGALKDTKLDDTKKTIISNVVTTTAFTTSLAVFKKASGVNLLNFAKGL